MDLAKRVDVEFTFPTRTLVIDAAAGRMPKFLRPLLAQFAAQLLDESARAET
jgi:hypothetical protein